MDSSFRPWIAYPPLTEVRLSSIATILRDVRQETVAKHEPDSGDTEWSLGCRIYSRSCFAIRQAAENHDWLTILDELETLRFSFAIGSIPFRFYKGHADDPPGKYIEVTFGELRQQQLAFEVDGVSLRDVVLRLAVETDVARLASRVILVEMNESAITNVYEIPFKAEGGNVVPMVVPPVSLPPVGLPTTEEAEEAEKEARNRDVSSQ
jgi:hypothetical protein